MITCVKINEPLPVLWWGDVDNGDEAFYSVRITLTRDSICFSDQTRNIEGVAYAIIKNKIIFHDRQEINLIEKLPNGYKPIFSFEDKVRDMLVKRIK